MVNTIQVSHGGSEASHGEDGGEPVRHVEPEAAHLAPRQPEAGPVHQRRGAAPALPHRVLGAAQRPVVGAVRRGMT